MSAIQMAVLLMVAGGPTPFNFVPTISADTLNYNLRDAAVAAGWNQTDPLNAVVTINSGVYVGSNTTSGYGFDTGVNFPAGTTLAIVNNGFIVGCGGNGGYSKHNVGESAGSAGGPAFRAQVAITVTNNGTIGGGGGGGGGGGRSVFASTILGGGGGGGGRGYIGGAGGAGDSSEFGSGTAGSKGAAGTGAGLGRDNTDAGAGGNGGDLGGAGYSGATGINYDAGNSITAGGAGGAAGAAVVGNSNITWVATGTRLGSIT